MSKMLAGSFVALITPFNKDGSVDFAAFRTLLKFQEDNGSAAILIMGSTGESSMLSPEEKKQIIVETAKMKTAAMPIFLKKCTGQWPVHSERKTVTSSPILPVKAAALTDQDQPRSPLRAGAGAGAGIGAGAGAGAAAGAPL